MQSLADIEYPSLSSSIYNDRLPELQLKLTTFQHGLFQTDKRAVIVFEGTDAAGKGGCIRRMVALMDPRGYRAYPIGPPTPDELARHYLQRFWRRLPTQGQLAIFDRSWYGRVLVERVEELTKPAVWQRAYRELNEFERILTDDGVILIKFLFVISQDEQDKRFIKRLQRPEKRWKITCADLGSRRYWDDYQQAYQDVLDKTSTDTAPWMVIPANNKRYARIAAMEHVCKVLSEHIEPDLVRLLDPEVLTLAQSIYGDQILEGFDEDMNPG